MNNYLNHHKGATLIEVMVSVLIFAIGITAVLGVCVQSMGSARRTEAAYTAYNLAKNHIDTLKALAFSDLLLAADSAGTALDAKGVPNLDGTYTRKTIITSPYQSDANLAQATVTVDYEVRGQKSANPMEMTTVIYKNG